MGACFVDGECIEEWSLCCLKHTTNELTLEIQFLPEGSIDVDDGRGCFLVGIARKGVSIDSVLSRLLAQSNNSVEIKIKTKVNSIVKL